MSLTRASTDTLRRALATAVAVPVTPYQVDGNPDWDTYAALTARLIDAGISVITPVKEALAQLGLCRADVRPPSRPLPVNIKAEISGILTAWGMR